MSLVEAPLSSNSLSYLASGASSSSQLWHVDRGGSISSLTVEASASGISLTGRSDRRTETAKLVTLPGWSGVSETRQRIILPKFQGDSLKISLDVDSQSLDTSSMYQLAKAGENVPPAVIYRDPRFIMSGERLTGLPDAAEGPRTHAPRGLLGKRRLPTADAEKTSDEGFSKRPRQL